METNNAPGLVLVGSCKNYGDEIGMVYEVPDGIFLCAGDDVIVTRFGNEFHGVCLTDTVYLGRKEYDFVCKSFNANHFPTVSARMTIQRFDEPKGG